MRAPDSRMVPSSRASRPAARASARHLEVRGDRARAERFLQSLHLLERLRVGDGRLEGQELLRRRPCFSARPLRVPRRRPTEPTAKASTSPPPPPPRPRPELAAAPRSVCFTFRKSSTLRCFRTCTRRACTREPSHRVTHEAQVREPRQADERIPIGEAPEAVVGEDDGTQRGKLRF